MSTSTFSSSTSSPPPRPFDIPQTVIKAAKKSMTSPKKHKGDNESLHQQLHHPEHESYIIGPVIKRNDIDIALKSVPITIQRQPWINLKLDQFHHEGVGRVMSAPSNEFIHGNPVYHAQHQNQSVLQQHIDFFDPDGDGIIWPHDTFIGFHMIGFNIFLSFIAMMVVHSGFSYATCPSWIPDPIFRIWTSRIHKAIHGSDSDTYDSEGRFVPQKFEDIFSKYSSSPNHSTLSFMELLKLHKGNRNVFDPFGWFAEGFELLAIWLLLKDDEGLIHKHELRAVFDGSLFYQKWDERKDKEKWYWRWITKNRVQSPIGQRKIF